MSKNENKPYASHKLDGKAFTAVKKFQDALDAGVEELKAKHDALIKLRNEMWDFIGRELGTRYVDHGFYIVEEEHAPGAGHDLELPEDMPEELKAILGALMGRRAKKAANDSAKEATKH
jgi:hypothetical protein